MRSKFLILLGLLAAFLTLTAENCILETKEVEVPVRDGEEVTFTTQGNDEHSGEETVDFTETLLELEEDNDFEALLAANIEAGYWRVVENRGDDDLIISGSVTVTRLNPSAGSVLALAGNTEPLITYTSVAIDTATGAYKLAPLNGAGVALLNEGFDEYLQARAQGQPVPDLQYRFDWSGMATSPSGDPDTDFDWQAKVKFILTGLVTVDVPDPF
jgi:hypothetical protein